MRHEAQATPAPAASESVRIDYGEEIDLPATSRDLSRPILQPTPEPVAVPAAAAEALRSVSLPRHSAPAAPPAASPLATPIAVATTPEPAAPAPSEAGTQLRQIVVPVKLPPGARYEIVIKLQLDTTG
jgi:hypothetical protein